MNGNLEAVKAWLQAKAYRTEWGKFRIGGPELPARIEYALRRIGGLMNLDERSGDFIQAYNEAPFVDENQDTANSRATEPEGRMS